MINSTLKQNDYFVVRHFIDPETAENLGKDFEAFCVENNVAGDSQSPCSSAVGSYLPFLELLCEKTPDVSKIVGETVLPTYTFARVYKKNADLKQHTDRDSCELSLTVHLRGDQPWDFWIRSASGEDVAVLLNPGDAIFYHGCKATHWRNTYHGDAYTQVFLHYVYSKGERTEFFFDSAAKTNDYTREIKGANTSLKNYIMVIKDLVPHDLCEHIVHHLADDSPLWTQSQIEDGVTDTKQRNCSAINLTGPNQFKHIDNAIYLLASEALKTYKKTHPTVSCESDTGYNLLRYNTGGFYVQHCDSFKLQQRELTCSFILNDDYEGGEFAFFNRELKYKLNKGDAILFPSNFMYPHEIMPVTSGKRYAIITWYV